VPLIALSHSKIWSILVYSSLRIRWELFVIFIQAWQKCWEMLTKQATVVKETEYEIDNN